MSLVIVLALGYIAMILTFCCDFLADIARNTRPKHQ